MDDTYDVWVYWDREGWSIHPDLLPNDLIKEIDYCEKNKLDFIVYKTKDRVID